MGLSRLEHRLVPIESIEINQRALKISAFPSLTHSSCISRVKKRATLNKITMAFQLRTSISTRSNVRDQTKGRSLSNATNLSSPLGKHRSPTSIPDANLESNHAALHSFPRPERARIPGESSRRKEVWNCWEDYYYRRVSFKGEEVRKVGRCLMKLAR